MPVPEGEAQHHAVELPHGTGLTPSEAADAAAVEAARTGPKRLKLRRRREFGGPERRDVEGAVGTRVALGVPDSPLKPAPPLAKRAIEPAPVLPGPSAPDPDALEDKYGELPPLKP